MYVREGRHKEGLVGKPEGKRAAGKLRREENNKMDTYISSYISMKWIVGLWTGKLWIRIGISCGHF